MVKWQPRPRGPYTKPMTMPVTVHLDRAFVEALRAYTGELKQDQPGVSQGLILQALALNDRKLRELYLQAQTSTE